MAFVLVTNSKGGVGKTTLTASLALTAQNSGHRVALIDLDRQKSLSRFAELANIPYQSGLQLGPRKFAKKKAAGLLLIDTKATLRGRELEEAVAFADAIIVPCTTSHVDIEATSRFLKRLRRIKDLKKGRAQLIPVLNRMRLSASLGNQIEQAELKLHAPIAAWFPSTRAFEDVLGTGRGIQHSRYARRNEVLENLQKLLHLCGLNPATRK
jgi:chromosome partitioning protein